MEENIKIKRALISVSDKSGLDDLARALDELGIEIISTGGTLKKIKETGVQAVSISAFTGCPEVMDGRVKTLHPKVHGAILYRRDNPKDVEQLAQLESKGIDLVVVNLYPFEDTLAREDAVDEDIIENIDIGGPTLIRAASKNFEAVTVVVDPADYKELIEQLKSDSGTTNLEFRKKCAAKAFAMTCAYDSAIAGYFTAGKGAEVNKFPEVRIQRYNFRNKLLASHSRCIVRVSDECV